MVTYTQTQEHEKRLSELELKIQTLEDKIDKLSDGVADLVSAWRAASWLVNVVKVIGSVAAGITAIVALLKGFK